MGLILYLQYSYLVWVIAIDRIRETEQTSLNINFYFITEALFFVDLILNFLLVNRKWRHKTFKRSAY